MWFRKHQASTGEADQAVEESANKLQATVERTAAVVEITTALRVLRERNHFVEQLRDVMGGRA